MKVKYTGQDIGVCGLKNNGIYEVIEVDELTGLLRVVDEDTNDWNYDNDPDWKPGYLYSPISPRPVDKPEQQPGKFTIVEDDERGTLHKAIPHD